MTENEGSLPSYSGDENEGDHSLSAGAVAVTDRHFNHLSESLSYALSLHTSLVGQGHAWTYRLLRELTPLVYEAERLLSWVVTYAHQMGESKDFIARAMSRPKDELVHWLSAEARAESFAVLGKPLDDDWNVSTGEAYLHAQGVMDAAEDERARAQALMDMLLLHLTPSYEADELIWTSEAVRRAVKHGWTIEARPAHGKHENMDPCDQSSSTSTPPKPRQESSPEPSASGSTAVGSRATARTKKAEPSSTSAKSKSA
ncbi:hypothetical protein ACN2WE_21410 [Streptomyces sp. cg28]|uniref:hypothetical protein n=1 Tax=Streptomyces sp. cg28 TaxID=3403457 RepID=UPI003B219FDF